MLFDVVFFGLPAALMVCLAAHALRGDDFRFWLPAFATSSYCLFYLVGGKDVLLYLTMALLMGGGVLSCAGSAAGAGGI